MSLQLLLKTMADWFFERKYYSKLSRIFCIQLTDWKTNLPSNYKRTLWWQDLFAVFHCTDFEQPIKSAIVSNDEPAIWKWHDSIRYIMFKGGVNDRQVQMNYEMKFPESTKKPYRTKSTGKNGEQMKWNITLSKQSCHFISQWNKLVDDLLCIQCTCSQPFTLF